MPERLPNYGGQALIEGVMMRGRKAVAMAFRAPSGEIIVRTEDLGGFYKSPLMKIPFLRGLVGLWDALVLGMRALTLSANIQSGEEEKIEGPALYITLGGSLTVGIGLFFLLPAGLGQLTEHYLHWSAWVSNLLEGLVRLALLIGYVWAIGRMPEIARVFAYHGAEHKTINAYEARADLTVESIQKFSVEHPRCGTAFLLTLVLLSILVFSLMGPMPALWRFASRILLLPVLAGLAYEFIRFTAEHLTNPLVRLITRPNLALQNLTTREPTADMLEVSLSAFQAMLREETKTE